MWVCALITNKSHHNTESKVGKCCSFYKYVLFSAIVLLLLLLLFNSFNTHTILDVGWVEHDTDGRSKRLRRKGNLELGTNLASGAVGADNLAPDGTSGGSVDGALALVDEDDALAQVSLSFSHGRNVFQFQDGSFGSLSTDSTAVTQVTSLQIKSANRANTTGGKMDSKSKSKCKNRNKGGN